MTNPSTQALCGLVHVYDAETDTTSVSWSYRDDEKIDAFILEYYDADKRLWLPYDGYMGLIPNSNT